MRYLSIQRVKIEFETKSIMFLWKRVRVQAKVLLSMINKVNKCEPEIPDFASSSMKEDFFSSQKFLGK